MIPVIMGMYHSRIKYPEKKKEESKNQLEDIDKKENILNLNDKSEL